MVETCSTFDPGGAGAGAPFQVWCDMTTDGGGWTLVTSVVGPGAVTAVGPETLVSPASAANVTNRGMRLPGVTEILVVNDGRDAGFEEAFDRADRYAGVTGLGVGWDNVLSAFNEDSGASFSDGSYVLGVGEGWSFDATRVNAAGCLQAPLRDGYGSGNYLMMNVAAPYLGIDIGLLWHHWGNELWLAGAIGGDNATDLRCAQELRNFTSFWKGLSLR